MSTDDLDERNDYDSAARFLLRYEPWLLLAWLLSETLDAVRFIGWLDTRRLTFPLTRQRTNDLVANYTLAGENGLPRMALVEIEYRPTRTLAGRLLAYLGFALNDLKPTNLPQDEYQVGAIVLALTGRSRATRDTRCPHGKGVLLVPHEVNLADLDAAEILEGYLSGTVPWPVLAWFPLLHGADRPGLGEQFRALVAAMPNDEHRGLLKAQALVYAEVHGRGDYFRELLKEINVILSPYCEELRNEGRMEVRREERMRLLVQILNQRFGVESGPLTTAVQKINDVDRLRSLLDLALSAPTVAEFAARL